MGMVWKYDGYVSWGAALLCWASYVARNDKSEYKYSRISARDLLPPTTLGRHLRARTRSRQTGRSPSPKMHSTHHPPLTARTPAGRSATTTTILWGTRLFLVAFCWVTPNTKLFSFTTFLMNCASIVMARVTVRHRLTGLPTELMRERDCINASSTLSLVDVTVRGESNLSTFTRYVVFTFTPS